MEKKHKILCAPKGCPSAGMELCYCLCATCQRPLQYDKKNEGVIRERGLIPICAVCLIQEATPEDLANMAALVGGADMSLDQAVLWAQSQRSRN